MFIYIAKLLSYKIQKFWPSFVTDLSVCIFDYFDRLVHWGVRNSEPFMFLHLEWDIAELLLYKVQKFWHSFVTDINVCIFDYFEYTCSLGCQKFWTFHVKALHFEWDIAELLLCKVQKFWTSFVTDL